MRRAVLTRVRQAAGLAEEGLLLGRCSEVASCSASSSAVYGARALHAAAASGIQLQGWSSACTTTSRESWGVQSQLLGAPWHQPAAAEQRRGMFIQTQPTPNPQSLMFVPGKPVMESGSKEFPNARAGMASPLAKRLFAIDGVTTVFFGGDFITVTKKDDVQWAVLKPLVFAAIMDHYGSGEPVLSDEATLAASDTAIHEDDDEVVAMIKELLETRIRPAVQEDGGDITFRNFDPDSGIVTVKMMGACSGCPSSTVTLKSGIENMLMHYIPEVKGVVEDTTPEEHEDLGMQEFAKLEAQLEESGEKEEGSECSTSDKKEEEKPKDSPLAQHLSA